MLLVELITLFGNLFERVGNLVESEVVRVYAVAAQDAPDFVQRFLRQLAAEFDVHAAARHVRRNRNRMRLARAGDDVAFLLVFLRIQDRMRHALAQNCFELSRIFDAKSAAQHLYVFGGKGIGICAQLFRKQHYVLIAQEQALDDNVHVRRAHAIVVGHRLYIA